MKSALFCLAVLMAIVALPAGAAVITVTPVQEIAPIGTPDVGEVECTNGWSIVTNRMGWGALTTFGPSMYFARNQVGNTPIIAGYPEIGVDGEPSTYKNLGRGTFYATCDMWAGASNTTGDKTPSTVWLGTNTFKGTPLAGRPLGSITKMEYYSFVDKCPTRMTAGTEFQWWAKPNWWFGPQQPIQIHLAVYPPNNPVKLRQVWYRPWGANYVGDDGLNEPGSKKGRWQRFNCLTQGKWYYPQTGTTPDTLEDGWEASGGLTAWQNMMAEVKYGIPMSEWVFSHPSTDPPSPDGSYYVIGKSPGWDGQTNPPGSPTGNTGTGMPFNFFVGARKTSVTPLWLQGGAINWYNHSFGERAQVDYLTLGFLNEGEETYDFEPPADEAPVRTVALPNKALKSSIWDRTEFLYPSEFVKWPYYNPPAKMKFLVKITGQVGDPPANYLQSFTIEDGSMLQYIDPGWDPTWIETIQPNPIRVFLQNDDFRGAPLWLSAGDTVSVEGYMEPLRFPAGQQGLTDYVIVWTNINNVIKH